MQAFVHLEGKEHLLNTKLPTTALQLKQMISNEIGVPVKMQHLHDFPEIPSHQSPQLNLYADDFIFNKHVLNRQVNCVLTFGNFSSWAYFYVHFNDDRVEKAVFRFKSHRMRSIADVKKDVCLKTKLPVKSLILMLDRKVLADKLNLFQCGIKNGTNVCCSVKLQLKKLLK